MRIYSAIPTVTFLILLSMPASAGLFGKILKGGALVGAGAAIGSAAANSKNNPEISRLKKMNKYAWEALVRNDTEAESLEFYLDQLAESRVIGMVDTAAFGYAALGDKEKAIDLYK